MYSKLVFVRKCNPVYEDYYKKYSTIRFYSETIVELAKNLGINKIEIAYFDETYASDIGKGREDIVKDWFNNSVKKDLESENSDSPVVRMYNSAKDNGIDLDIFNIQDYLIDSDALIVLSFMTDTEKVLSNQFNNCLNDIIKSSKGFIYLSSDNEYSGFSYKKDSQIGCLEYIGDRIEDDKVLDKMRAIIMTESNKPNIAKILIGKFGVPVFYLPMIIDNRDIRFTEDIDVKSKINKVAMLKNLTFFKDYHNFFESIRNRGVVWESSMPPIQQKFKPICEEYGFEYKFARFWRMSEFERKLSDYKFFLGMSTIGSSRFTSKILEGTNANTYVISPKIDLQEIGFSIDSYPICNKVLNESGIGEVYTPDLLDETRCDIFLGKLCEELINISDDEFIERLLKQRRFIYNYFTKNSPCVEECMNHIISYLKKVGELEL